MRVWFIEVMLFIIIIHLLFMGFSLVDQRTIAEIKLCKDNPTLVINNKTRPDCNCKELLEKYNIEE